MKLKLITLAAIVFLSAAVNETRVVAAPSSVSAPLQVSASENNWIEIGEVTIHDCYNKIKLRVTLYAMYLGERMLYRVQYNGASYSVSPNPNYGKKDYYSNDCNAQVIINDIKYYLGVPNW